MQTQRICFLSSKIFEKTFENSKPKNCYQFDPSVNYLANNHHMYHYFIFHFIPLCRILCLVITQTFTFSHLFFVWKCVLSLGEHFIYGTETMICHLKRQGMEVGVWDGNTGLTISLTQFLLTKPLTYFLNFLLSKWYIEFLPIKLMIVMICRTLSWPAQLLWIKLRRTWNLFYVLQEGGHVFHQIIVSLHKQPQGHRGQTWVTDMSGSLSSSVCMSGLLGDACMNVDISIHPLPPSPPHTHPFILSPWTTEH